MNCRSSVALVTFFAAVACGNAAITEPVVANTGTARSIDGYEAAVAAAEAEGFPIVVKDRKHAFVRVRSRSSTGLDPASAVYLDVKAWSGSVDVRVEKPPGLTLPDAQVSQVRNERQDLAWAIATRARLIAGEAIGPTATDPSYTIIPPFANFSSSRAGP